MGTSDRATEYELLRAAGAAGVAVPQVRILLRDGDRLGSGFIMDRIAGETIPRKILRDPEFEAARPRLASQCGRIAAAIHAALSRSAGAAASAARNSVRARPRSPDSRATRPCR